MAKNILLFSLLFLCFLSLLTELHSQEEDTLIVGYTPASPFIIKEGDRLSGISIWLWERCARELQLPYRYQQLPFGAMLDSVKSGRVDVSINPLTITNERLNQMDFTHSFYASHSIVAKRFDSKWERLKNFLRSFFSLSFLSGFVVLLILIVIFGFLEWHFERHVNHQNFRRNWKGVWDGLWWSVVTMTTVGYGDKAPKSRGGKIVALVWMFSGLLFVSGITASIASTLTVNQLSASSAKLADFKDRPIGTIARTSSASYLHDRFFRDINLYPNVLAALDALLAKEIDAFIYDEPIVSYYLANEKKYTDLNILPEKFNVQFYAFAMPKIKDERLDVLAQKVVGITERNEWQEVLKEYNCGE